MARKIVKLPDPDSLTFSSLGPPLLPCRGWHTEEFESDQDPNFFARVHWNFAKKAHFVQYFHRELRGWSSPTLRDLLEHLRKVYGPH